MKFKSNFRADNPKNRTLQNFRGGAATHLLLLILSAAFSRHKKLGAIFYSIKIKYPAMKRGRSAHSALADFNRTKDAFYML